VVSGREDADPGGRRADDSRTREPERPGFRPALRRRAGFLATAVLLVLGLLFLRQTYGRMLRPQGNDLTIRLAGAQALLRGENPYAIKIPQGPRPDLLMIDTLAIPLTWVPEWLAQAMWFGANVAALVGSLLILDRLWPRGGAEANPILAIPFPVRLLVIALAILVPLQSHMMLGQVNLVLLLLCCLFLRAHVAGRPIAASLALGGAIALKLTPAVFLVALARERRYCTLVLVAGSVIVWAVVFPYLVSDVVLAFYLDGWLPSLRGFTDAPVTFDRKSRFTLAAALVYLWPAAASIPGLRYWAAVAVLAPIAWLQGRAGGDPRGGLLIFALYLLAMPLISPLSGTHHLAVLAAPLWVWLLAAGDDPSRRPVDLVWGLLFLTLHWLGVPRRASLFDALALVTLYVTLVLRAIPRAEHALGARRCHRRSEP
jgi:Glycosyltransferase family 87